MIELRRVGYRAASATQSTSSMPCLGENCSLIQINAACTGRYLTAGPARVRALVSNLSGFFYRLEVSKVLYLICNTRTAQQTRSEVKVPASSPFCPSHSAD